jgi:hypothetical protein
MTTHQTSLGGLNMTNLLTQAVVPSEPSYRFIPLTQGQFAIVDAADFDWLNQSKWHALWSELGQCYYARRASKNTEGKWVIEKMHNVIMPPRNGYEVDHHSGNTLDYRRDNLRYATRRQQCLNRKTRSDNTSGCKGVSFCNTHKCWIACISINGKWRRVGMYKTREEAVAARKAAEREHYGEFAR